jgi:phosphoribosylanthranilate isomerase
VKTLVKVCGITRAEDARAAVEAGADLIGFVFAPSPRRVDAQTVARIVETLPPGAERVGVFVNEAAECIREIARIAGLTMIQLHGSEPPEMDELLDLPVLRALRIPGTEAASAVDAAGRFASPLLLIEPSVPGVWGGTGLSMDWGIARSIVAALPHKRIFLAGGLDPDNVRQAIAAVRPYGVEASSGLEDSPGRKSPQLIRRFVETVRTS